jgi:lysophospholipase L1-like esterase
MFCTRGAFNKMRMVVGLLLLEVIISGLKPLPVSSAQIVLPDGGQRYVSEQNSIFLPVIFNSFEIPVTKIYCMGDSLTEAGVYETELMALLGSDWLTINLGRSGDKTSDMFARFQADVIDSGDADYVLIWGGVVDLFSPTEEDTETNLQAMYTMAHNVGIKVVAVNIIPLNDITAPKKMKLLEINSWIQDTAINVDYVADVYTAMEDPDNPGKILPIYDSGDHVHLSNAGYAVVAETIYNAVTWTR